MRLSACTEWLFFHLWKSNPENGKSCEGVIIPETVIFRWAWPYFWYFTNTQGRIVRKTKEKIQFADIHDVFTKNMKPQDICALNLNSKMHDDQEQIEFEYFIKKDLQPFLSQREKQLGAILQRFVIPQQSKNHLIKVIWTPQFCLFFKRKNIHDIKNTNISVNERVSTFNGLEHLSEEDPIKSPSLQKDIENTCLNIMRHIQQVSHGNIQIAKMEVFFKLDQNNQLQILFCTDLKIRDKYSNSLQSIGDKNIKDKRYESPTLKIIDNQTRKISDHQPMNCQNGTNGYKPYDGDCCYYCKKKDRLFDLQFNKIIDSYDMNIMTNQKFLEINPNKVQRKENYIQTLNEQGIDINLSFLNENYKNTQEVKQIPLFLEYIWGPMTNQEYQLNKKNKTWNMLVTKVCQECYMDFTQFYNKYDYNQKVKTSPNKSNNTFTKSFKIRELSVIQDNNQQMQLKLKNLTLNSVKKQKIQKKDVNEFTQKVMNNKTKNYFFNNTVNKTSQSNHEQTCLKFQFSQKAQAANLENQLNELQNQKQDYFKVKKTIKKMDSCEKIVNQSMKVKFNPSKVYRTGSVVKKNANSSIHSNSTLDASKSKINHNNIMRSIQDMRLQLIDI